MPHVIWKMHLVLLHPNRSILCEYNNIDHEYVEKVVLTGMRNTMGFRTINPNDPFLPIVF